MENAAVPKLIKLLKDDYPQAMQYTIKALGEIGNDQAISYLESIA